LDKRSVRFREYTITWHCPREQGTLLGPEHARTDTEPASEINGPEELGVRAGEPVKNGNAGAGMGRDGIKYPGCRRAGVNADDAPVVSGTFCEHASEYLVLKRQMAAEVGASVYSNLTDIASAANQVQEERQF
jgi:hypothetical protein